MTTFGDRYFQSELYAEIESKVLAEIKQLSEGYATTFDEYRYRVGYLKALQDVRAIGDKIMADLTDKPKRTLGV